MESSEKSCVGSDRFGCSSFRRWAPLTAIGLSPFVASFSVTSSSRSFACSAPDVLDARRHSRARGRGAAAGGIAAGKYASTARTRSATRTGRLDVRMSNQLGRAAIRSEWWLFQLAALWRRLPSLEQPAVAVGAIRGDWHRSRPDASDFSRKQACLVHTLARLVCADPLACYGDLRGVLSMTLVVTPSLCVSFRSDSLQIDRAGRARAAFRLHPDCSRRPAVQPRHDRMHLRSSALARAINFVARLRLLRLSRHFGKARSGWITQPRASFSFSSSAPDRICHLKPAVVARVRSRSRRLHAHFCLPKHLSTSEQSRRASWARSSQKEWNANLSEIDLCFREIGDDILVVARQRQWKSPTSDTTKATRLRGSERREARREGGRDGGRGGLRAQRSVRSGLVRRMSAHRHRVCRVGQSSVE